MRSTYFPGLNTLRFYAATCVVVAHAGTSLPWPGVLIVRALTLEGYDAVTLFFVLSGFLITYLLLQERQTTGTIWVKGFYVRRAVRILPLYYLIVALSIIFFPVANALGYLPILLVSPHLALPFLALTLGLGQAWSIGVEEWFYLAWPVLVKRFSLLKIIAAIIILRLSLILIWPALLIPASKYPDQYGYWLMFLRYIHFESMAVGALGAWLLVNRSPILKIIYKAEFVFWFLFICIVALPIDGNMFDDLIFSFIFTGLILVVATKPKPRLNIENRLMSRLGQVTYGIYMYHSLVIYLLLKVPGLSGFPFLIAVEIVTVCVALVSYQVFEKPFLKLKSRFVGDRSSPGAETQTILSGSA